MSEGEWPSVTVGDLIERIEAGSSFRCRETPPAADEVGVAKVSAVSWGRYDEQESKTCLDASRINDELLIRNGDFLISRANTVELVGACVIAEQVSRKVMLSDKTLRLQFKDPSLKPWVLHFLRSQAGRRQIEALCTGNQDSMRNISQKSLRQITLPLAPPEHRQQLLADLEQNLSRVEDTTTTLHTILAKLKQARASILKAAVEGRLVEMEAVLDPTGPLDDSNPVPAHWQMKAVNDLFDQRLGKMLDKAKNSGEPTPYLRNANVRWQSFDLSDLKLMRISDKEIEDISIMHGDIVVCEGGEPGRCAVWKGNQNVVIQKALHRLRAKDSLNPSFFSYQIEDAANRGKLEQFYTGSTIKHLTGTKLRQVMLVSPPLEEQNLIVAEVERRFSVLDQVEANVNASLRRCGQLRQAVLKRAFGG